MSFLTKKRPPGVNMPYPPVTGVTHRQMIFYFTSLQWLVLFFYRISISFHASGKNDKIKLCLADYWSKLLDDGNSYIFDVISKRCVYNRKNQEKKSKSFIFMSMSIENNYYWQVSLYNMNNCWWSYTALEN
jgi:hypothetical protein